MKATAGQREVALTAPLPTQAERPRRSKWRGAFAPGLIVLLALGVRLWWATPLLPDPPLQDPDGYLQYARELADGSHPWHWNRRAVEYAEFFKAPLYPVALSALTAQGKTILVARWVLVANAALGACTVLALFWLGRLLHSRRAGLIASGCYAIWFPHVRTVSGVWQEHLYIPLLILAFALLAWAIERAPRVMPWLAAGAVFGLAALTRSAVGYFVPVAALTYVLARPGRARARCAAALIGGFLLLTGPYVVYISRAAGHFIFIEDVGSFPIKRFYGVSAADPNVTIFRYVGDPSRAPSGLETLRFIAADFGAGPATFIARQFDFVRLVWKLPGGPLLQTLLAPNRAAATLYKGAVHLIVDLPFILAVVLWPVGAVLSRRRSTGCLLAIGIAEFTVMLALIGWAGSRYRSPMEPMAMALSSVVIAGQWRRPRRIEVAAAAVVFVLAAWIVGLSMPEAIGQRVAYGITRFPLPVGEEVQFEGGAGVNVWSASRVLRLDVQGVSPPNDGGPVGVAIDVSGRRIDEISLPSGELRQFVYALPGGAAYVEIKATTPAGRPARMRLTVRDH